MRRLVGLRPLLIWSGVLATIVFSYLALRGVHFSSDPIPAFEVKITPNWIHPAYGGVNHNAVWVVGKSPTTPHRSPDSNHWQMRYLLLDPRYKDQDGRSGRDEWWFIIERNWPTDYPVTNHGKWASQVNFHSVAGDAGPNGGVGWGFGTGVSSLALDWPGTPTPGFSVFPMWPNYRYPLPAVERDKWNTYVVQFIAGRTDGTTVRPGALRVWVDGRDTPVINATNINTVQRAQAPDGNWYVQRWMQLWEGDYTMDLPVVSRVKFALTRVGATLEEAVNDRPTVGDDNAGGQYYRGTGENLGAPSAVQIEPRAAGAAAIPPSLRRPRWRRAGQAHHHDLGGDYFRRRDPERQTRRLIAQLEALGHTVTLQEAA